MTATTTTSTWDAAADWAPTAHLDAIVTRPDSAYNQTRRALAGVDTLDTLAARLASTSRPRRGLARLFG